MQHLQGALTIKSISGRTTPGMADCQRAPWPPDSPTRSEARMSEEAATRARRQLPGRLYPPEWSSEYLKTIYYEVLNSKPEFIELLQQLYDQIDESYPPCLFRQIKAGPGTPADF